MSKYVVILKHVANENAGTILDYLRTHRIPFEEVNLFDSAYSYPDLKEARALIVMGGPMNVYEEKEYPFLCDENVYIRDAISKRIPYLGVCLGSQLLAKAMGALVYKAAKEEIGWDLVHLTETSRKDPVLGPLRKSQLKVLQWHGDTFDLPKGAKLLATNSSVPHQAFCVDDLFYGFQFHVEVNRPMVEDWFKKRADLPEILREFDAYQIELRAITDTIYRNFLSRMAQS